MNYDEFKDNVGMKDIIIHLMNDNIKLQAQIKTVNDFLDLLMPKIDPNFDHAKVQSMRDALVLSNEQQIIADHPFYSDYMKNQLKGLSGLGADV